VRRIALPSDYPFRVKLFVLASFQHNFVHWMLIEGYCVVYLQRELRGEVRYPYFDRSFWNSCTVSPEQIVRVDSAVR